MTTRRPTKTKVVYYLVAGLLLAAVIVGWAIDRHFLNAKIREFDFSIGTQSLTDSYRSPLKSQDYETEPLTTVTQVTLDDLASCPRWNANSGDPPISARHAIELANAAAAKLTNYQQHNWQFYEIRLAQLDAENTVDGSHWCWQTTLYGRVAGEDFNRHCQIWILMNESVINSKVVKKQ